MLPSFTALSQSLAKTLPVIGQYLGPINPLKIFFPVLLWFVWKNRGLIPKRNWTLLGLTLGLGSAGTLVAAISCSFPPDLIREWAVICIGIAGALSLAVLPQSQFRKVIICWSVIIFGSVVLNLVFPEALNFINAHLFDPIRQVPDDPNNINFLMGFFDTASLAKLLVWIPWLLMWSDSRLETSPGYRRVLFYLSILGVCAILALTTTQRGPFVGLLAGAVAFLIHIALVGRRYHLLKQSGIILLLALALIPVFVPKNVLIYRVFPLIHKSNPTLSNPATASITQRERHLKLAFETIRGNPLGYPCIAPEEYARRQIAVPGHSHNIILEQFRSRGWIFGLWHFGIWLFALLIYWRSPSLRHSALLGGVVTTLVLGLADHPWFVINHALVLGTFLFGYIRQDKSQRPLIDSGSAV
ncbi:MAG TPA: hypothetical protein DCS07_16075 [Bdellovibrionales bacterium]|nr:MAG: hypothetical protein A2Z97_00655 [Bdellovibrionales bacterium GWB1_52_6]OFZ05226.1 MAG: hypothetical protein A2X97_10570 [Bdellovibrionales bacterium GWA1_52_35]HAR44124.1 hypothetical protein [Bdellovibrionales bacterium]HCM38641.1 hypothetical protein [Bdellovibrionales bacterium]